MFKILILQKLYNLSDEEIIFQIYDRLSFKNFLGISNKIPDKNTLCRETLIKHNAEGKLFNLFLSQIKKNNITLSEGTIVDATFVNVQNVALTNLAYNMLRLKFIIFDDSMGKF